MTHLHKLVVHLTEIYNLVVSYCIL